MMKRLIKQIVSFGLVSGTGWLIDFSVYSCITFIVGLNVGITNMISGLPAITFVFFVSTKKIFVNNLERLSIRQKYIVYFIIQIGVMFLTSCLGQFLYDLTVQTNLTNIISDNLKLVIKIVITPCSMLINFIVMKILTEKF